MALDQLDARQKAVLQWLRDHHVMMIKANERQWGSYEPAFSFDQVHWLVLQSTYGYGFTLDYACADTIIKFNLDHSLINWLRSNDPSPDGQWYTELSEIVNGRNHDVQADSNPDGAGLHGLPEQPRDTPEVSGDVGEVLDQ